MLRETKRYGSTRTGSVEAYNIRTSNESKEIYKGKNGDPGDLLVAVKFVV